jgi:TusA-related sulfurtransferase
MEILITTKIYDLLKEYPHLEEELIKINPKFKKLKNPVLKRTVARVASIKQAAIVGGMDANELLNKLRALVNQEPIKLDISDTKEQDAPTWIANEPKIIIDANELLDKEQNPLAASNKALKELQNGEILLIKSDFMPQPLIDEFKSKNLEVFSHQVEPDKFLTYIKQN